ncbi:MAG: hypothetical protein AAFY15_16775, partial [Cyanobacteria bacterium J06648_11]
LGERALVGRRLAWHACSKIEALDTDDGEPAFRPAVWSLDTDRQVIAAIPSKFSLFPLLAEHIADEANTHRWFEGSCERPIPQEQAPRIPVVAPTRSEVSLDLSEGMTTAFLHGRIANAGSDSGSTEQGIEPPIVHTPARLRQRWVQADENHRSVR